jgi:hypothetical protein
MIPSGSGTHTLVELDTTKDLCHFDFGAILFLDFDGVLHPEGCSEDQNFCYLPNFVSVLREVNPERNLPIVISSLWRHHVDLDEIRVYFPNDIAEQIIGVTPYMTQSQVKEIKDWNPYGGEQSWLRHRQREIMMWMNAYSPSGRWLAIDDRAEYFHRICPNLFLVLGYGTQGDSGLTESMVRPLTDRVRQFLSH